MPAPRGFEELPYPMVKRGKMFVPSDDEVGPSGPLAVAKDVSAALEPVAGRGRIGFFRGEGVGGVGGDGSDSKGCGDWGAGLAEIGHYL